MAGKTLLEALSNEATCAQHGDVQPLHDSPNGSLDLSAWKGLQ
jgi:hypothetical protein